jgi:hypothetical protein
VNLKINDAVMLCIREYGESLRSLRRVEYLNEEGTAAFVMKNEQKPWEGYIKLDQASNIRHEWVKVGTFEKVEKRSWLGRRTTTYVFQGDDQPVPPEPKPQRSGDTPEQLMAAAAVLLVILWLPGHLDTVTYWIRLIFCGGR